LNKSPLAERVFAISTMNTIAPKDAHKIINENTISVLDVRTEEEYKNGHIAGSMNIDIQSPNFEEKINSLNKDAQYVVYCMSGGRSSRAVSLMEQSGFSQVKNLEGGITAWGKEGLEIE